MNVKQKIDEIVEGISREELSEFMKDKKEQPTTVFGQLYHALKGDEKKYYVTEMANKSLEFGLINKNVIVEEFKELENKKIDVTTALEECIRPHLENSSLFEKAKILEHVKELTGEEITLVESKNTTNKSNDLTEYYEIKEALKVCLSDIKINESLSTDEIWTMIEEDEDYLLKSKVESYITVKRTNSHLNKALIKTNTEFVNDLSTVMTEEHREYLTLQGVNNKKLFNTETVKNFDLFALNKLEKKIVETSYGMTEHDINLIERGYENYLQLKENYKTQIPKTDDALALYIQYRELIEGVDLFKKAEAYINKLNTSSKTLKMLNTLVYTNTDKQQIIEASFIENGAILLEEREDSFYWTIKHDSNLTVQDKNKWNKIIKHLEETYIEDLNKGKRVLEKKFKGKKFIAVADTDEKEVAYYDTNNFRLHLYNDVKTSDEIKFNLEYYPSNYNANNLHFNENQKIYMAFNEYIKTNSIFVPGAEVLWSKTNENGTRYMINTRQVTFEELYELFNEINNKYDTEIWVEEFEKQKSKKQFKDYLLNGEHYELHNGDVIWYSSNDKKWMLDTQEIEFDELYSLYKQANKNNEIIGK